MTTRQEKVNSLIQHEVSHYLAEERPEGITGFLTLTAVDVSGDLSQAKIFFSSLGQDQEAVLKILQQHIYDIQGVLYERLKMKKVPRIIFVSDKSGGHAGRINKVLSELAEDHDHQT